MGTTATAKRGGRKGKAAKSKFPPMTWEIRNSLDTVMVFSVVTTGHERLTVVPGRRLGARAVFQALADSEVGDLAGDGLRAVRAADRPNDYPSGCVGVDEYAGGQAMYVATAVGAALRACEMLGADWPDAEYLAAWLKYPKWLCEVALEEYQAQRAG